MPSSKEYNQAWYQKNKEKHLKHVAEKTECICGKTVNKYKMKNHLQNSIHKNRMEQKSKGETKIQIIERMYQDIKNH